MKKKKKKKGCEKNTDERKKKINNIGMTSKLITLEKKYRLSESEGA